MGKQYVISMASVVFRNPATTHVVMTSKTLLGSAIKKTVQNMDIRGGENHAVLFSYDTEHDLGFNFQDARWDLIQIAMAEGTTVTTSTKIVSYEEVITLDESGQGILTYASISGIKVGLKNSVGTYENVDAVDDGSGKLKKVAHGAWAGQKVTAYYKYTAENIDNVEFRTDNLMQVFDVDATFRIFDPEFNNVQCGTGHIVIPRLRLTGNQEINLNSNNPYTSNVEGKALETDGKLAEINVVPISESAMISEISDLVFSPDSVVLDVSDAETFPLTVKVLRGDGKGALVNPSGVTFTSSNEAVATVDAQGIVTPVSAGESWVKAELVVNDVPYSASCHVTCIA